MDTRVEKNELLTILKANRTNHMAQFEEAKAAYIEALSAALRKVSDELLLRSKSVLRDDKPLSRDHKIIPSDVQALPIPEEHSDDFDRAIRMIELNTEGSIMLDEEEFRELVLDEWHWKSTFASNTLSYTGGKR